MSADATVNDGVPSSNAVSAERRNRSAQRKWRFSGILTAALFAALMFGLLTVGFRMHQAEKDRESLETTQGESAGLVNRIKEKISEAAPSSGESTADLTKLNVELQRAAIEIELAQTRRALHHLEDARADWNELLDATLSDSFGKRIAWDEELLLQFLALRQMPAPSESEPTEPQVFEHLAAIHREASSPTADVESIHRLRDELGETTQFIIVSFVFHQARLNHLHQIRRTAAAGPIGNTELHAAISMREDDLARELTSAADEAADKLEASMDEESRLLSEQRDDTANDVTHLESQIALLVRGEKLDSQADAISTQPLVSRGDYVRELQTIREDLTAFTSPGYVQPESADKLVYHKTKLPFSFSALKRIGALEDSEKGLAILFRAGGSKTATQQNDRPLGSFPRMNSISELRKPDVFARVKDAQRLLRTYGQLMVDDGLLSP